MNESRSIWISAKNLLEHTLFAHLLVKSKWIRVSAHFFKFFIKIYLIKKHTLSIFHKSAEVSLHAKRNRPMLTSKAFDGLLFERASNRSVYGVASINLWKSHWSVTFKFVQIANKNALSNERHWRKEKKRNKRQKSLPVQTRSTSRCKAEK